jgi:hypothetical protein
MRLRKFYSIMVTAVAMIFVSAMLIPFSANGGEDNTNFLHGNPFACLQKQTETRTYLGEACWEDEDGDIIRLGITYMGDGHFLLSGRWGVDESVHGNAEIFNSKVIMHLFSTEINADEVIYTEGALEADMPILSGTFYQKEDWYDKSSGYVGSGFFVFPLTRVPCP